jgi:hypothetical protein
MLQDQSSTVDAWRSTGHFPRKKLGTFQAGENSAHCLREERVLSSPCLRGVELVLQG